MLRNLISLKKQALQNLKRSLEALAEALGSSHGTQNAPIPIPVPVRQGAGRNSPFLRAVRLSPVSSRTIGGVRQYSTNPFNPFSSYSYVLRITKLSHVARTMHFSPMNPFNPFNRYKAFRQFRLLKMLFRPQYSSSAAQFHNTLRAQSRLANSIWNISAFRLHNLHYINHHHVIQSKAFFLSGLYKAAFPQTSSRLFTTTCALGGPIPGFSIQITSETIKNMAISFRTLFNLDNAYKPVAENENQYHPSKTPRRKSSRSIRSDIRLNQSLSPHYTAKTLGIGESAMSDEQSDNVTLDLTDQQSIINGCYVDFPLGGDLSIPSMTFLTDEILGEINANLTYITRRINELKQDFMNLGELGELPIKYLAHENVLRVYFPNCDREMVEVLLREKNVVGGTIHENVKGPKSVIAAVAPDNENTPLTSRNGGVGVGATSYVTENDLISSLYQSGNTGSSTQSSEESSIIYDDGVLSSYGSSSDNRHHPLSDAEVVRIGEFGGANVPMGPIAISDYSSGEYHWVERQ